MLALMTFGLAWVICWAVLDTHPGCPVLWFLANETLVTDSKS
jgi:hypothetical protein